ncbi:MAG TPA: RDD family protein [Micromonosporaceae bacterium]
MEGTVELVPADLARRFGALVVDWILCLLIARLFGRTEGAPWLPSVILIIEYAFFIGLFGQTPGMYVIRIRCVSIHDGGRIGLIPALIRGVLLALVVPALIMDGQRRGWHDKAAGSMMVPAPPRSS